MNISEKTRSSKRSSSNKEANEAQQMIGSDQVKSYFLLEKWTLLIVTLSGILYNVGMVAGPWFEGQLAQRILDIMKGKRSFRDMVTLALLYVVIILLVQLARYVKRLYVRKFANHVNRNMKQVLYNSLIHHSKMELEAEGTGNLMTKAISDVDTCVEGMRKFTTEVFDTGIVMIAYLVMLMIYDWRLTLISCIFPPIAYVIAEKLKKVVSKSAAAYKESAGRLNAATMDRVSNAITYRVYGQEVQQNLFYEEKLKDYEKKAVYANIWENAMQPLYQIISMMSILFILWFGAKNVLAEGWTIWNIAAFTTFLSCFTKLAVKSSKAAKLFNAVQKARVSWQRIKPFMGAAKAQMEVVDYKAPLLNVSHLAMKDYFEAVSFKAEPGEIIGLTGPVACGKSTFGKAFLGETPYEGSIKVSGMELYELYENHQSGMIGYMGHQPELLSDTIENNTLLGEKGDVMPYLKAVCMEEEVDEMPDKLQTMIGNGGVRLSGGQQARLALARTLFHKRPIMVLDDPFSAVDKKTELKLMATLRNQAKDRIVFLISHRLAVFPQLDQVLWMDEGRITVSHHEKLMIEQPKYVQLYKAQMGGTVHEDHK